MRKPKLRNSYTKLNSQFKKKMPKSKNFVMIPLEKGFTWKSKLKNFLRKWLGLERINNF